LLGDNLGAHRGKEKKRRTQANAAFRVEKGKKLSTRLKEKEAPLFTTSSTKKSKGPHATQKGDIAKEKKEGGKRWGLANSRKRKAAPRRRFNFRGEPKISLMKRRGAMQHKGGGMVSKVGTYSTLRKRRGT